LINITFVCFGNNFYEFHSEGHSGLNPGNDIVCAGVSALSYALLGTLKNIQNLSVEHNIQDGNMSIEIKSSENKAVHAIANTVFTTVYIGLKQLEISYPNHVKVNVLSEESS